MWTDIHCLLLPIWEVCCCDFVSRDDQVAFNFEVCSFAKASCLLFVLITCFPSCRHCRLSANAQPRCHCREVVDSLQQPRWLKWNTRMTIDQSCHCLETIFNSFPLRSAVSENHLRRVELQLLEVQAWRVIYVTFKSWNWRVLSGFAITTNNLDPLEPLIIIISFCDPTQALQGFSSSSLVNATLQSAWLRLTMSQIGWTF
jgi:hypothetical protein